MRLDAAAQNIINWRENPIRFAYEVFGYEPSEQQKEGLLALRDKNKITIRSGHGTGKDANAAIGIWWFIATRKARGLATAPTNRQLTDILWGELTKWHMKSPLTNDFIVGRERIYHKQFPNDWWFRAAAINVKASAEQQGETLAGYHYEHFLIVVDEASGVPDPVFKPLEGTQTQADNKIMLIGNMTRSAGFFYDTHFKDTTNSWTKLHWNSEESTNVTKEFIDYYRKKYGVESDVYRIRVLGEPPRSEGESLVPLWMSMRCADLEFEPTMYDPVFFGLDVARHGDDRTVLTMQQGRKIFPQEVVYDKGTIEVAEWAGQFINRYDPVRVYIDGLNMGAGVVDQLRRRWREGRIIEVIANANAYNKARYYNKRSEMYMRLREAIESMELSLPQDPELFNELAAIKYTEEEKTGVFRVAAKKTIKKDPLMKGLSPDKADSLSLLKYELTPGRLMRAYRGRRYGKFHQGHRARDWRTA